MCIEHDGIGWLPDQINLAISDPVNLTIYTFHELQNFNPRILRLSECCMDRTGGDWLDRGKDEKEERRKERKKEKRQLPSQPETAWPAAACACSIAAAPESENSISVRPSFSPPLSFFLSLDFFFREIGPRSEIRRYPGHPPERCLELRLSGRATLSATWWYRVQTPLKPQGREKCQKPNVSPTQHFILLPPENPPFQEFYAVLKCRSRLFGGSQIAKDLVGC